MDQDRRNVFRLLRDVQPFVRELQERHDKGQTRYHIPGKKTRLALDKRLVRDINRIEAQKTVVLGQVKLEQDCFDEARRRRRSKRQNQLSGTEVDDEIHALVVAEQQTGGLGQREGEKWKDSALRVKRLNRSVEKLWDANADRIRAGQPRYINGLPAELTLKRPIIQPHVSQTRTGLEACLQCRTKKLRCSHTATYLRRQLRRRGDKEQAKPRSEMLAEARERKHSERCERCVRNGTPCMVVVVVDEDENGDGAIRAITKGLEGLGNERQEAEMLDQVYAGLEEVRDNAKLDVVGSRLERTLPDNFALPLPWMTVHIKQSREQEAAAAATPTDSDINDKMN
ncbi:hypothetical protein HJFPF1_03599 [Paramyrothecium foliicola]|nr:hypothetical protein HJFPF1_03599 [Paramyrothecium foliicola]